MPTLGDVNDERVLTASWEELQKQGPGRDPVHDGEPRRVFGTRGSLVLLSSRNTTLHRHVKGVRVHTPHLRQLQLNPRAGGPVLPQRAAPRARAFFLAGTM